MLIYKITNLINKKLYIGQTIYDRIEKRIANYKKEINSNTKRPIINAMRKYGIDNFKFEIVEDNIISKIVLDEKERYYIQYYQSLVSQNGYNIELGGNGPGKHSEETKRKISEAQLGEKNHMFGKTGSQNATSKKILDITTDKVYESANLAAQDLQLNFSHICAVARGTRGSTGGHVFRYLDENNQIILNPNRTFIKQKSIINKVLPQYKQYI